MAVVSIKNKLKSGSLLVGNAAFIPTDFESIATATATGSSATITFDNIPDTYAHLQIRGIGRSSANSGFAAWLTLNGDTGNNYSTHELRGNGSSVSTSASADYPQVDGIRLADNAAGSGIMGASIIDILDYANTNKYKTVRILSGADGNSTSTSFRIVFSSGAWRSTSAVTSVSITAGNNFTSTTTFALYGIKA